MSQTQHATKDTPYTVYPGTAAQDIELDSQILKVICPDLLPHTTQGDVAPGMATSTVSLNTPSGNKTTADVTIVNHFVATWDGDPYMRHPPMVRRGEPVELFRRSNQDKWYWRATGRGRNFRTTDRMYCEISATSTNSPNPNTNPSQTADGVKNDDTTYSFYMDSVTKKIGFKTSSVNGEACRFSGEFDLASGMWSITDNPGDTAGSDSGSGDGNRIFMDTGSKSGTPVFQVNNSKGTTIKFQGEDCYIKVPKRLFVDIGERAILNSPITFLNRDTVGYVFVKARSIVVETAKDITAKIGGVLGIDVSSTKITGDLIVGRIRAISFIKGVVGSLYKSSTCAPADTAGVTVVDNAADTNYSGAGNRHAAAAEQFIQAMTETVSLFNEVKAKTGAPSDPSSLNTIANASTLSSIQGDS